MDVGFTISFSVLVIVYIVSYFAAMLSTRVWKPLVFLNLIIILANIFLALYHSQAPTSSMSAAWFSFIFLAVLMAGNYALCYVNVPNKHFQVPYIISASLILIINLIPLLGKA